MKRINRNTVLMIFSCLATLLSWRVAFAQQHTLAFSSVDSLNANWYIAKERQLYKKYGLDVELIFIPSSTTTISAVVAGSLPSAIFPAGRPRMLPSVARAWWPWAALSTLCPTTLSSMNPYDRRSSSRVRASASAAWGSSSDVAARVFLKELKLEPDKDVAILQVGGSTERAAAFRTGRIVAFPAPPGVIHLPHGMPHRILASTADFPKGFPFPYVCPTASKSFVKSNRDTMKRLLMALIDATHFFKTRKEESKKIMAKYTRHNNEAFLESAYQSSNKLFEQMPLVNREGIDVQVKDAVSRKPGSVFKVDDVVDHTLVLELDKEGFISRIYK